MEVKQHADAEDVGGLGSDLPQVTALEDQVGQGGVQRVDAGERMGRVLAAMVTRGSWLSTLEAHPRDRWHNLTAVKCNGGR